MMRGKTEKDCTGIEDEIFKKIKKGDMSWLPIKRSSSYGMKNDIFNLTFKKIIVLFRKNLRISKRSEFRGIDERGNRSAGKIEDDDEISEIGLENY